MSTLKMNGSSWAALILLIALAVSMSPVASHAERADEVSADAVYKEARELLARDSFREAAERFREISNSYNDSKYTADALYWEAFSLYRLGRLNELKEAMGVLERQIGLYPEAKTRGDALELATRIRGELARRGDADAAEKLAEQVMQLEEREARALTAERNGREGEKDKVDETKLAALQALINMDSDRALPILKKIMQKRDKDSERLRVEA
ncbi:MAG: hypothetical protein KJ831_01595, partial [Candidatus Eisenbacteria bacterium]|nr:hypothetical protein [Candidatus Eisenbacteria bacterium]